MAVTAVVVEDDEPVTRELLSLAWGEGDEIPQIYLVQVGDEPGRRRLCPSEAADWLLRSESWDRASRRLDA